MEVVIGIVLGVTLLSAGDMIAQTWHQNYCRTCRRVREYWLSMPEATAEEIAAAALKK